MIETTVFDYLTSRLNIPVYMEIPADPEDSYIVIEKTGSSKTNRIETATLAIQSYAKRLEDAAILNEVVKSVVEDMVELNSISAVRLNSDYNFTDTTTKNYRYQAVYVITYL